MSPTCLCGASFATQAILQHHATLRGHSMKCSCGALFGTEQALHGHQEATRHSAAQGANSTPSLIQPTPGDADAPSVCNLCNRSFRGAVGLNAHIQDKHNPCPTCDQAFATRSQRLGHQRAAGHCYCAEHDLALPNDTLLRQHMREEAHVTGFECTTCDRTFTTEHGLEDHLRNANHPQRDVPRDSTAAEAALARSEEAQLCCFSCNKKFRSLNAFKQHKASVKHHPLSDLQCPLDAGCSKTFTSPSALLFHLESGGCKSGMNRLKLNALVHAHDTARHITYGASTASLASGMTGLSITSNSGSGVILTPEDSEEDSVTTSSFSDEGGVFIATPEESDATSTTSGNTATIVTPSDSTTHSRAPSVTGGVIDWSYITNGNNMPTTTTSVPGSSADTITYDNVNGTWPCTICGRTFRKKSYLVAHLNSPAHAPKLFHCPTAVVGLHRGGRPAVAFKTLSGMAQHIEAGACAGGRETLYVIVGMFENRIRATTGQEMQFLRRA